MGPALLDYVDGVGNGPVFRVAPFLAADIVVDVSIVVVHIAYAGKTLLQLGEIQRFTDFQTHLVHQLLIAEELIAFEFDTPKGPLGSLFNKKGQFEKILIPRGFHHLAVNFNHLCIYKAALVIILLDLSLVLFELILFENPAVKEGLSLCNQLLSEGVVGGKCVPGKLN